ncbi:hypothetical protein BaRGS_00013050, partial [Batillaria attramentaria]
SPFRQCSANRTGIHFTSFVCRFDSAARMRARMKVLFDRDVVFAHFDQLRLT